MPAIKCSCGFWLALLLLFAAQAMATTIAYRPKTGICGAAAAGDLAQVRSYLQTNSGAINEQDNGETPLH